MPEIGWADWEVVDGGSPAVAAVAYPLDGGRLLTQHNLSGKEVAVELPRDSDADATVLFASASAGTPTGSLPAFGYRWLRLPD